MEGYKDSILQVEPRPNPVIEEGKEASKRIKIDEEGDGVAVSHKSNEENLPKQLLIDEKQDSDRLNLPKRASARELNYIDTKNILPDSDLIEEGKDQEEVKEEDILKKTAKKVGEYFKKVKKTKSIQFESRIEDISELNALNIFRQYCRLKKKSSKLDMFIKEKLTTLKESLLQPPTKLKQNLRLKISSTYNNSNSEWNLRIEGKISLPENDPLSGGKESKMMNFFEKIFIDFEDDDSQYMNIDWRKLNNLND
mmetsp:Transcript_4224/g.3550  ORF Transcript_4224/g.3550 Transcript_4224/m.3550 type:complete len:253 (+) Transcript_4224:34-792(+)